MKYIIIPQRYSPSFPTSELHVRATLGPLLGLEVSLFWGAANLLLVGVSLLSAMQGPEWRKHFRVRCQVPCLVITPHAHLKGTIEDFAEDGALVTITQPLVSDEQEVLVSFANSVGDRMTVNARIRRQERRSDQSVGLGLQFLNVDSKTMDAIFTALATDSRIWNEPEPHPGVWRSLWSMLGVFRILFTSSRHSQRRQRRMLLSRECRLESDGRVVEGRITEISPHGLSVKIDGTLDLLGKDGKLYLDHWVMRVRRIWAMDCEGTFMAGFRIETLERGAEQWRDLYSQAA